MGKVVDEAGNRYGKLLVLEQAESRKGRAFWLCQCDCGKTKEIPGRNLRVGITQSCGCSSYHMIDETGNRYGKLVVAERAETADYVAWVCRCDCGNERHVVRAADLRRGRVQSCGCTKVLPYGHSARNALISTYRRKARKQGRQWALSREHFFALTKRNCFYCGAEPHQVYSAPSNGNGSYTYNGVDRVDSREGYTLENTVPACGRCNQAKNDMSVEEFYAWVDRLYAHIHSQ